MLRLREEEPVAHVTMSRTAFGRLLRTVEVYAVDGCLVDSGPPATAGEIVRFASERRLRGVVNTHHHEDHTGGDRQLHRVLGWVPRAPAMTVPLLARPPHIELYRRVVWGDLRPVRAEPIGDAFETDRYRFRVISTPGHCPDHTCLWEPSVGWLFSADLFISERVKYLRADEDARLLLDSLRRVVKLEFGMMFCSHAGIVPDGPAAIRHKLEYWGELQARACELLRAGYSPEAVRDRVLGPEGAMTTITRGHFSKLNLIKSLVCGLDTDPPL